MNGKTLLVLLILVIVTSWLMPTIDYHVKRLDQQATERIDRLKALGRLDL